jgi:hypothetical protein
MRSIPRFIALISAGWLLLACAGTASPPQTTLPPVPTRTTQPTIAAATREPVGTAVPAGTPEPSATVLSIGTAEATAPPAATGVVSPERIAAARAFADLFLARDYAAVVATFDATMQSVFPAEKVKEAREALDAQLGAFQRTAGTQAFQVEQSGVVYDVVLVTLEFERQTINLRVVYNPAGQVAGLFFQPAQPTPTIAYSAPDYVRPDAFSEQEVTVGSGDWALPGTLSLPVEGGPFPALVLVHGSGPNDRDETIGPNQPFKDLAWGLASRGIAVLRYVKRSRQYGDKFTEDVLASLTAREETTDDALAAVSLLRHLPGIDAARIYVLGHSLGGYLLPRIGAADPRIAGLIVLAGPARPLEDSMLEQYRYIFSADGTISDYEQEILDELVQQVALAKSPYLSAGASRSKLPLGTPASFWIDLRGYHPAEVAAGLPQRMLILQGARDYQVTTADFEVWKAALSSHPDVRLTLYPDLNHLFMPGEGMSTPEEYGVAGHVAEPVVADIAAWLLLSSAN